MLQFISGKEYTSVLEIYIDENNVKPGDILLDINFIYDDIITKETITLNVQYKYELKSLQFTKANEEYIRCQTYNILEEATKLREQNQFEKGRKILRDMKTWLENNYNGQNNNYLEDIKNSEKMFEKNSFTQKSITNTMSMVSQNINKRIGANLQYSNMRQSMLQDKFRKNLALSKNFKK